MAGAEQRPGQERPFGRPVFQQFEPGGTGTPGEDSGESRENGQLFNLDRPLDLVGNLRVLIEQERARSGEHFNAAWWLRKEMRSLFYTAGDTEEEKALFFDDLHIAWGFVAWDELADYRHTVYTETRTYRSVMQSFGRLREGKMQLSPLGVTLLDAMAEALGIEHTPGQDTFDLSLFRSTVATARIESGQNPEPTSEEVKRAITKSVDIEQR